MFTFIFSSSRMWPTCQGTSNAFASFYFNAQALKNQDVCKIDELKGPKMCESSLLTHNAHVTIFCHFSQHETEQKNVFASSWHLLSTHMVDLWLLDCGRDCVFGLCPPEGNSWPSPSLWDLFGATPPPTGKEGKDGLDRFPFKLLQKKSRIKRALLMYE